MNLKTEDFSYECNSQGYIVLYKGRSIGGAGSFNHLHEPVGAKVQEQTEKYRGFAKNAIQNILAGNPGHIFKEAIDKINEEETLLNTKIFDLKKVQTLLNGEEPEFDEENDMWTKHIYIGSVMGLLPSGKYYMPFACSNVHICKTCQEAGSVPCTEDNPCVYSPGDDDDIGENEEVPDDWHCEACKDARWFEQAEKELESIDAYMFSGEGDATDLFIGIVVETGDE